MFAKYLPGCPTTSPVQQSQSQPITDWQHTAKQLMGNLVHYRKGCNYEREDMLRIAEYLRSAYEQGLANAQLAADSESKTTRRAKAVAAELDANRSIQHRDEEL